MGGEQPDVARDIRRGHAFAGRVHREHRRAEVGDRDAEAGRRRRADGRAAAEIAAGHEILERNAGRDGQPAHGSRSLGGGGVAEVRAAHNQALHGREFESRKQAQVQAQTTAIEVVAVKNI